MFWRICESANLHLQIRFTKSFNAKNWHFKKTSIWQLSYTYCVFKSGAFALQLQLILSVSKDILQEGFLLWPWIGFQLTAKVTNRRPRRRLKSFRAPSNWRPIGPVRASTKTNFQAWQQEAALLCLRKCFLTKIIMTFIWNILFTYMN